MGMKVLGDLVRYSDLAEHTDGTFAIAMVVRSSQCFSIDGHHLSVA